MSTRDLLDMAFRNLWKRKLRTFLTILGVVIGTASIVVMISIGLGMNESFARQLEGWGSLQVIDVYSTNSGMGMHMGSEEENKQKKKGKQELLDASAVDSFRQMENVEAVSPIKSVYLMMGYNKLVADANIIGIEPSAMEALGYKVDQGRTLTGEDVKSIVIGGGVEFYNQKLSWEMRMNAEKQVLELVGEKVEASYDYNYGSKYADKTVKPIKYEVVGMMPAEGNDSWSVIMPIKEVEKLIKGREDWEKARNGGTSGGRSNQTKSKEYEQVRVKVNDINNVQAVQQAIKDRGFRASSLTDQLESMKETTKMLRMVLGAIGAISLVVAAIGITNTMVMAIYERTREIGIMKVIGASLRDIKVLFLTEAAIIGFGGGILGVAFSFVTSKLVNFVALKQASDMTSSIPLWLYLGSIAFATVIGVLAGYLPAQRAMKLSALSAIKTE